MAHIAEDRHGAGVADGLDLAHNATLGFHSHPPFSWRGMWLSLVQMRRLARGLVNRFGVQAVAVTDPLRSLSGGNQQKLVVGRELSRGPELFVAAQPTRGLDVAAAAFVHSELAELRRRGAGVLLVSLELTEILALADRIVVMSGGQIAGETTPGEVDVTTLGRWMTGGGLGGRARSGRSRLMSATGNDSRPSDPQSSAPAIVRPAIATRCRARPAIVRPAARPARNRPPTRSRPEPAIVRGPQRDDPARNRPTRSPPARNRPTRSPPGPQSSDPQAARPAIVRPAGDQGRAGPQSSGPQIVLRGVAGVARNRPDPQPSPTTAIVRWRPQPARNRPAAARPQPAIVRPAAGPGGAAIVRARHGPAIVRSTWSLPGQSSARRHASARNRPARNGRGRAA